MRIQHSGLLFTACTTNGPIRTIVCFLFFLLFWAFFLPNFYDEIKQKALLPQPAAPPSIPNTRCLHLHIYAPRLRTSEFPHSRRANTFLTYSRFYSLPRDTISLQIKDNGGQVNTGCAETVSNSAALSHPRHTDVEISCKGSTSRTERKNNIFYHWARWRRRTDFYFRES